jgi:hypothetical protein
MSIGRSARGDLGRSAGRHQIRRRTVGSDIGDIVMDELDLRNYCVLRDRVVKLDGTICAQRSQRGKGYRIHGKTDVLHRRRYQSCPPTNDIMDLAPCRTYDLALGTDPHSPVSQKSPHRRPQASPHRKQGKGKRRIRSQARWWWFGTLGRWFGCMGEGVYDMHGLDFGCVGASCGSEG